MKKKIFLLGHPVAHSFSPTFHNSLSAKLGLPYEYKAIDVSKKELKETAIELKLSSCVGFNITSPHKIAIGAYIDKWDESALSVGSVNTVLLKNNKATGYNTDVYGFEKMMEDASVSINKKNILIMGTGGAASAVVAACQKQNSARIDIASRNPSTGEHFLKTKFIHHEDKKGKAYGYEDIYHIAPTYDIVVNATPVGMKGHGEGPVVSPEIFKTTTAIVDLIYAPRPTRFLKQAKEKGLKTVDGLGMLMHQGIKAYELWTGAKDIEPLARTIFQQNFLS